MKEIIGENLNKRFSKLGIKGKCTYMNKQGYWENFSVWELCDEDYDRLCLMTDSEWDNAGDKNDGAWWRGAVGSNLGDVNCDIVINHVSIRAWEVTLDDRYLMCDEDIEDIEYLKETLKTYPDILTYFCSGFGVSTESNVCALAVDLARQNNISMSELFKTYGGE